MSFSEKSQSLLSKIEVVIAVVLFFAMLISCGLYIDIKLNGKISNLPPISENDKKMLLLSSVSDSVSYSDDLLEPTFIGFKQDEVMSAVLPSNEIRRSIEENIYESFGLLFDGEYKKVEFDSKSDLEIYIERIKYSRSYMLVGFFDDLPSSVVIPCVFNDHTGSSNDETFFFKYLFILPDKSGNVYGCAVSDSLDVVELFPKNSIKFDKILNETYDVREGFTEFEFSDISNLYPVLNSSFNVENIKVTSFAQLYGKDDKQSWINNLFDVFSFNSNLVRNFISGDGLEINYVEESNELLINDNGVVEFKTSENGVFLDDFLGNISDISSNLSFSEKIFALKNIINSITYENSGISYSFVGTDYDNETDSLKAYFKYMFNGAFVFDSGYDAVFEIKNNALVYAKFLAVTCSGTKSYSTVMPQNYASFLTATSDDHFETFLVMNETDGNIRTANWANAVRRAEVKQ